MFLKKCFSALGDAYIVKISKKETHLNILIFEGVLFSNWTVPILFPAGRRKGNLLQKSYPRIMPINLVYVEIFDCCINTIFRIDTYLIAVIAKLSI